MFNWLKKKANPQPQSQTTKQWGFKIGPAPKTAKRREMLYGPDITASGGCRTVHHEPAH
jgi:hypothetical protein